MKLKIKRFFHIFSPRYKQKKFFWLLFSALLLGISFSYSPLWFVSFFALLPLINLIYTASARKEVFVGGWLFGFLFLGGVLIWMWNALPLTWAGVESGSLSVVLVFGGWFLATLLLSLFVALWSVTAQWIIKKKESLFFLLPFLWIFFEYVRMWGFAIVMAGEGSSLFPHFSIGFIGYSLAGSHTLLQFGEFFGVYGLSFVVVAGNVLLYRFFFAEKIKRYYKQLLFILLLILLMALHTPPQQSTNLAGERTISLALVTTQFPSFVFLQPKEWDRRISFFKESVRTIAKHSPETDIIIFPEGSRFLNTLFVKRELYVFFDELFADDEKLIIDSSRVLLQGGETKSIIFYYNTKTKKLTFSQKIFVTPYGEYLPYYLEYPLRFFGGADLIEPLKKHKAYSKGRETTLGEFQNIKIGGLFCSEIASPFLYNDFVKEGADILLNVASHASFHRSSFLYQQILSIAKVHAVFNNRPFVQASNFTSSFVINKNGILLFESVRDEPSLLFIDLAY